MTIAVLQEWTVWIPTSTPLHASTLHEGLVFGVVKECLLRHLECTCKHGNRSFAREVLSSLDICDLIHGYLTQFGQILLTQVRVESQFLDTYAEVGLNGLYPLHTPKCGKSASLMTPSISTGYSIDTLVITTPWKTFPGQNQRSLLREFRE